MGEAGDDLYSIPQGPAAVGGLQGQHPVLAKADWGSSVGLHRIRETAAPDVPPSANPEGHHLSVCMGEGRRFCVARRDTLYVSKKGMGSGKGAAVSYVELETDISVYLQGKVLCKGSGQF